MINWSKELCFIVTSSEANDHGATTSSDTVITWTSAVISLMVVVFRPSQGAIDPREISTSNTPTILNVTLTLSPTICYLCEVETWSLLPEAIFSLPLVQLASFILHSLNVCACSGHSLLRVTFHLLESCTTSRLSFRS